MHQSESILPSKPSKGLMSRTRNVLGAVGVAAAGLIYSQDSGAIDLISPSGRNIFFSPVYSGYAGNIWHQSHYDEKGGVLSSKIIPQDEFKKLINEVDALKKTKPTFEVFCNSYSQIVAKYGADLDMQIKIFEVMWKQGFLHDYDIGAPEFLGKLTPEFSSLIHKVAAGKNADECKQIAIDYANKLESTQSIRDGELQNIIESHNRAGNIILGVGGLLMAFPFAMAILNIIGIFSSPKKK